MYRKILPKQPEFKVTDYAFKEEEEIKATPPKDPIPCNLATNQLALSLIHKYSKYYSKEDLELVENGLVPSSNPKNGSTLADNRVEPIQSVSSELSIPPANLEQLLKENPYLRKDPIISEPIYMTQKLPKVIDIEEKAKIKRNYTKRVTKNLDELEVPADGIIRGQWTSEEDTKLRIFIKEHGITRWKHIAKELGTRTAKQCRERWHNHLDPNVNKTPFTAEENVKIIELYNQNGAKWASIAKLMPGRTDAAIKNHFNGFLYPRRIHLKPTIKKIPAPGKNKSNFDAKVRTFVEMKVNSNAQPQICSSKFKKRKIKEVTQLSNKPQITLSNLTRAKRSYVRKALPALTDVKAQTDGIIRGPWTGEEDSKLLLLITDQNIDGWTKIGKKLGTRTGKQCRERWYNHLDPTIIKTPFTPQEDLKIIELYNKYGAKWASISKLMPGRTDNAIKNHFNSFLYPRRIFLKCKQDTESRLEENQ